MFTDYSLATLVPGAILYLALSTITLAQPSAPKRALLIHDYGQEAAGRAVFDQSFQRQLRTAPAGSIELYSETLELYRFPGEQHAALVRDYLKQKYAGIKVDVVVAVLDSSLQFVQRYRNELFPGVPIVYLVLQQPSTNLQLSDSTGLLQGTRVRKTLEIALQLQPDTERVFIVSGRLNNDVPDEQAILEQVREFEDRVDIHYFIDLSFDDLTTRLKTLPPHSIVLFPRYNIGVGGKAIPPNEAAGLLAQSSNMPVYGIVEPSVGTGIVGGEVMSLETAGADLASRVLQIMNGKRAEDLAIAEAPTIPMFDWRQLRRFNISEEQLPAGSVVRFKQLTVWEQYKGHILFAVVLILLQTVLISTLLIERSRKLRAAQKLTRSEDRFGKAFKANPQPMSITTLAEGRYIDVNDSFLNASGYMRDEVIGHTSIDLQIFENEKHRMATLLEPLRQTGSARNLEMPFRNKDGSFRVFLSSAEMVEIGGEQCILLASSDITARKEAEERLAELTGRLLRTQDEERRRIARELHDVTAQSIGLMMLNLGQLQNGHFKNDSRSRERITDSLTLGEQALKDIRTLSYVLHPPLLDQAGLIVAGRWLAKGFSERSGIQVTFTEHGQNGHRMPSEVEYALFRVLQECLTNIRRHTSSAKAEIELALSPDEIVLSVHDHGEGNKLHMSMNGNDVEAVGVGIPGMVYRLRQLGGDLLVDSDLNGTTVTARVPVRWNGHDSGSIS